MPQRANPPSPRPWTPLSYLLALTNTDTHLSRITWQLPFCEGLPSHSVRSSGWFGPMYGSSRCYSIGTSEKSLSSVLAYTVFPWNSCSPWTLECDFVWREGLMQLVKNEATLGERDHQLIWLVPLLEDIWIQRRMEGKGMWWWRGCNYTSIS